MHVFVGVPARYGVQMSVYTGRGKERTWGALVWAEAPASGPVNCTGLHLAQSSPVYGPCVPGFALGLCSVLGASWCPAVVLRSGD